MSYESASETKHKQYFQLPVSVSGGGRPLWQAEVGEQGERDTGKDGAGHLVSSVSAEFHSLDRGSPSLVGVPAVCLSNPHSVSASPVAGGRKHSRRAVVMASRPNYYHHNLHLGSSVPSTSAAGGVVFPGLHQSQMQHASNFCADPFSLGDGSGALPSAGYMPNFMAGGRRFGLVGQHEQQGQGPVSATATEYRSHSVGRDVPLSSSATHHRPSSATRPSLLRLLCLVFMLC